MKPCLEAESLSIKSSSSTESGSQRAGKVVQENRKVRNGETLPSSEIYGSGFLVDLA